MFQTQDDVIKDYSSFLILTGCVTDENREVLTRSELIETLINIVEKTTIPDLKKNALEVFKILKNTQKHSSIRFTIYIILHMY